MAALSGIGAGRRRMRRHRRGSGRRGRRRTRPGASRAGSRLGRGDERFVAGRHIGARIRIRRLRRADDRRHARHRRRGGAPRAVRRPWLPVRYRPGRVRASGPATLSSSRAGTGRRWSLVRSATRAGGPFWLRAPTWPGWTAPISRRAPISTSIRNVMPSAWRRTGGPPARRPRPHRHGVAEGGHRRGIRIQAHLGRRPRPRPARTPPTGSRYRNARRADTKRRH